MIMCFYHALVYNINKSVINNNSILTSYDAYFNHSVLVVLVLVYDIVWF